MSKKRHKSTKIKYESLLELYRELSETYSQQGRKIEEIQQQTGYSKSQIYNILKEYKKK